jgi:hypothetical protein
LGIGDWAQSPIPNPQSPIPNPHKEYLIFNKVMKIPIFKCILYILEKCQKNK